MGETLRLLYKFKGWYVFAPPLIIILLGLIGVDNFWRSYIKNSERIDSLEMRIERATALVSLKTQWQNRIDAANVTLKTAQSNYFVSPTVAESRAAFLSTVTSIVAEMNLPKISINELTAAEDAKDVVPMQIALSFDASPAQLARLEARLAEQPKTINFQAMTLSIANGLAGAPGAGLLNVTYQLQSIHINSNLF